jgi:hypothetical protein
MNRLHDSACIVSLGVALGLALTACGDDTAGAASTPVVDASPPASDAAFLPDAAPPVPDAASLEADAAPPQPDAAPLPDAAPPWPDFGAPPSPFGPAGRVDQLDLPASLEAAQAAGCQVVGAKGGSGLTPLGRFLGDGGFQGLVDRQDDGAVGVVLLVQAAGFETGAEGERVALRTYYGDAVPGAETFTVDPSSLDADGHAVVHWPALALGAGGAFASASAGFVLTLPLGMGLPSLRLRLERATLRGALTADAPGVAIGGGFLEGYLTRDSLLGLVVDLQAACSTEPPPDFCEPLRAFFDPAAPPEMTVNVLLALVGGYDVGIDEAGPHACSSAARDCNAIGVCLEVGASGVAIDGLTP